MKHEDEDKVNEGLEGKDCVPFFENDKSQIIFEFFYLIVLFILACAFTIFIQKEYSSIGFSYSEKTLILAIMGGFFGGWVYDAKWFYRVTARGKNNQYNFLWQPHKFYWRILTPHLAALVAFSTYLLASSDLLPIQIKGASSGKVAFGSSFVLGYFSDLVLSRLAAWAETIIPKARHNA